MKKLQSVLAFKYIYEAQVCLAAEDIEAAQTALDDLEDHLQGLRDQWWKDNRRTFGAVRKLLNSFYSQAWSPRFERTERKERALSFFTNQILDQFVLGGDPLHDSDDMFFSRQRRQLPENDGG